MTASSARSTPVNKHAPTGDGVKDLRPLPRAPYRALLDPAAYLDAPNNQRRPKNKKINNKNTGLTGPAPSGMTSTNITAWTHARPGGFRRSRRSNPEFRVQHQYQLRNPGIRHPRLTRES
jgi:hypothetical protein